MIGIKNFVWTRILPSVCLIGIVTNIINIIVFSQRKKLQNSIYRYFQWHSIFDLVYLSLCLVRFILKTEAFGDTKSSLWVQIYDVYVYAYITSSLAISMILIELIIATKRLLIIMNFNLTINIKFRSVIALCVGLSLVSIISLPLSLRVVNQKNCNYTVERIRCLNLSADTFGYAITQEKVPHVDLLKGLYAGVFVFRGMMAPLILILLNIAIAIKFRKLCAQKKILTRQRPASSK